MYAQMSSTLAVKPFSAAAAACGVYLHAVRTGQVDVLYLAAGGLGHTRRLRRRLHGGQIEGALIRRQQRHVLLLQRGDLPLDGRHIVGNARQLHIAQHQRDHHAHDHQRPQHHHR